MEVFGRMPFADGGESANDRLVTVLPRKKPDKTNLPLLLSQN